MADSTSVLGHVRWMTLSTGRRVAVVPEVVQYRTPDGFVFDYPPTLGRYEIVVKDAGRCEALRKAGVLG